MKFSQLWKQIFIKFYLYEIYVVSSVEKHLFAYKYMLYHAHANKIFLAILENLRTFATAYARCKPARKALLFNVLVLKIANF